MLKFFLCNKNIPFFLCRFKGAFDRKKVGLTLFVHLAYQKILNFRISQAHDQSKYYKTRNPLNFHMWSYILFKHSNDSAHAASFILNIKKREGVM